MSTVEFNDRVAIVTGAGAGLGREHAKELARRGVKVVVNDFGGARDGSGGSAGPAEEVVNEIKAEGGEAMPAVCSVADMDAAEKMVADAIDAWGHVDILVNNAGVTHLPQAMEYVSEEDFEAASSLTQESSVRIVGTVAAKEIKHRSDGARDSGPSNGPGPS